VHINIFKVGFFFCILLVTYLSTTVREIEIVTNNWDKSNHFFAFFILYYFLYFGYKKKFAINMIILLSFAIQVEIVQYFIPGRTFSILDIIADVIGIIFGYLIIMIYLFIKIKQKRKIII